VGRAGVEPDDASPILESTLGGSPKTGGAESGAVAVDPALARVVAAWPTLSAATRRAILKLIDKPKR
jgi:hypothetical protein